MDELKASCPWCNSKLTVTYEENRVYKAVCAHCGKTITFEDKSRVGAFDTLNRRTQPENKPTVRKECAHMQFVEGGIPYCEKNQTACNGCIGQENKPHTLESCEGCIYEQVGLSDYPCEKCIRCGGRKEDFYAHKPEQEEK